MSKSKILGCRQAVRHQTLTLTLPGFESLHPSQNKRAFSIEGALLFCLDVGCFEHRPTTRALWDGVRIFRPKIEKLVFQAQDGISFPQGKCPCTPAIKRLRDRAATVCWAALLFQQIKSR